MTPRLQNAVCRVQEPRGSGGGGRGVPTWPLTAATVWCQKSDAGRGGNPDRRLNREAARMLQRPRGQDSPRAPWVQVPFSWRGGPGPGEPHKLVQVWFNSRPRSHFGASDSPAFNSSPKTGTSCAAHSPRGQSPNGPVPPEHNSKPAFATWASGKLASTPSVSCGGFIPGLSARVVVWVHGVEVSFSVVVPTGSLGVRVATTDCAGIAHRDAGALLFPGTRPGQIGTTWRKSRTNERSRTCRECRQPQPSLCNLEFPFLPSPGPVPRSIRGRRCPTAIRSSCPRRPRSSSRRQLERPGSGTGSRLASLKCRRTACRVCGVGESRVGESTGLPRREAWGALSGHCRCRPWQYAGRILSPPLRAGRSVKKVGADRSPLMTPARRGWSMNRGLPTVTARVSSRLDLFPKVLGCFANDRPTVKTGWKTRTEYFFR